MTDLKRLLILGVTMVTLTCSLVSADLYFHVPRGSNNRLNEQSANRANANRLFDSQNNNRGGYNAGDKTDQAAGNNEGNQYRMSYFQSSPGERGKTYLTVEWTNQHGCGGDEDTDPHKQNCVLVLQYMCQADIPSPTGNNANKHYIMRNGVKTDAQEYNAPQNLNENRNSINNRRGVVRTDRGLHESWENYDKCYVRERNKGLFTADQKLKQNNGLGYSAAAYTRQNPNGNRRGYECPEERDYYPYWHPTPWRDIVVMTNDATRCPYYQEESQNVKSRWHCLIPRRVLYENMNSHDLLLPNNQEDCKNFRYPENNPEGVKGEWVEIPAHGISAPECMETQMSRDNHLGNGLGGYPLTYNWTVPNIVEENCALRIRYNISTDDYDAWDSTDASNNKQEGSDFSNLDLAPLVGLADRQQAEDRGFVFKNNPQVQIFPGLDNIKLQLAINTAQFARTFQDRSHTFEIRSRPAELMGSVLNNVNVRGKRGNIVQVYPAVEYDFVPNTLSTSPGQYVHFQWTGSNTNPPNNDGQGLQRTDRSNIVVQAEQAYSEGTGAAYQPGLKYGHWGRSYPATISNTSFLGLNREDLVSLATLHSHQFRGEMSELDDAGTYFDLGPRKVTDRGVYHFLSTRNNNFSNRSQKGRIIVWIFDLVQKSIGWNGGQLLFNDGMTGVSVPQGTFGQLHNLRLEKWDKDQAKEVLEESDKKLPSGELAGDVLILHPEETLTLPDQTFEIFLPQSAGGLQRTVVYITQTDARTWTTADYEVDGDILRISTDRGGYYAVVTEPNVGAIAGIVIGTLVIAAVIVITVVCVMRKSSPLKRAFAREI